MKKAKAGEVRLATKRSAKRKRHAKVAAGMACRDIEIDFERVAQVCAIPREDQEKILGAEALQVLDVLMHGCSVGGFQL
jgi:hypothetical protein